MDSPPPIQRSHRYEVLRSDIFIAYLTTIRHSRLIAGMLLFLIIYVGVMGFGRVDGNEYSLIIRAISAVIWIIFALAFFCVIQLITGAIIAYSREHKGLLGIHTLVITEEGLIERTDYNETLHRWKGFHRIRETPSYLYLYTTETNYHQIPKRSFASGEDMKSFLTETESRTKAV